LGLVNSVSDQTENSNDPLTGLSKPWQKFFKRFEEIETRKVSQWGDVHVLAYICKRFEQHYGRKFSVTIKNAPTKSPDIRLIKCMMAMLGTTNMYVIKEYVDWVYDKKIIPQKKNIRTLAFFMTQGLGNEFYFEKEKNNKITRSSALPDEYKSLAVSIGVNVNTYGELAFIKKALDQAPDSESRAPYRKLFLHLKSLGFNESMLEEVK
jgi:hypothetical protein